MKENKIELKLILITLIVILLNFSCSNTEKFANEIVNKNKVEVETEKIEIETVKSEYIIVRTQQKVVKFDPDGKFLN